MDAILNFIENNPAQVSALAAVVALLVSLLSIILVFLSLVLQRRHNFKSVTPIASLPIGDYENKLEVYLKNTGVGPLMVLNFIATNTINSKNDLISLMPSAPDGIYWETFTSKVNGLVLPPNESSTLIKLVGDTNNSIFTDYRDEVRKSLSNISIEIEYKDIYTRTMPTFKRKLDWFGRHVN